MLHYIYILLHFNIPSGTYRVQRGVTKLIATYSLNVSEVTIITIWKICIVIILIMASTLAEEVITTYIYKYRGKP